MRNLIAILLFLLPLSSNAQNIIKQGLPNNGSGQRGGFVVDSMLRIPVKDTSDWYGVYGNLTIRPQDNSVWYRANGIWQQIGSGGSGNDSANIFTGTLSQSRALTSTPSIIFTTDYGGGTWVKDDTVTVDNTGTQIRTAGGQGYSRVYSGYANFSWFGAVGDGVTDNAIAFQRAIDFAMTNPMRPKPLTIDVGNFITSGTMVANGRDTNWAYNTGVLEIKGSGGRGANGNYLTGTTITKTTAGPIIRVCAREDGSYPGGGKDSVYNPLNFMRALYIQDINFTGLGSAPQYSVGGILGRGIERTTIKNCSFSFMDYGIQFGPGGIGTARETSTIQGIDLDYNQMCLYENNSFTTVRRMLYTISPDVTKVIGNQFSPLIDSTGFMVYWAAGNDYIDFTNNIFNAQTRLGNRVPNAIRFYATRGAIFEGNHFEQFGNNLFSGTTFEDIQFRNNLLYTTQGVSNVFNIATNKDYARLKIENNIIAIPSITSRFVNLTFAGDDSVFTKAKTLRLSFLDNKATTTLGGNTKLNLTSNFGAFQNEEGQTFHPIKIGTQYWWTDSLGFTRTAPVSAGIPTSNTFGNRVFTTNGNIDINKGDVASIQTYLNLAQNSGYFRVSNAFGGNQFLPTIETKATYTVGSTLRGMLWSVSGGNNYTNGAFSFRAREAMDTGMVTGGNLWSMSNHNTMMSSLDYQGKWKLYNVPSVASTMRGLLVWNSDSTISRIDSTQIVTAYANTLNEKIANKSMATALGTSNTLYPTQNAVKTYVDSADNTKLPKTFTSSQTINTKGFSLDIANVDGGGNGYIYLSANEGRGTSLLLQDTSAYISAENVYFDGMLGGGNRALTIDNAGKIIPVSVDTNVVSSAASLTMSTKGYYSFTGTTTTWTLGSVSDMVTTRYVIANMGSGSITINAPANTLWEAGTTMSSTVINAGETAIIYSNGTYWTIYN